jgi:hypothetical protein
MLNYYRISDPNDVRDLGEQMAAWLAAGNPKADAWAEQPAAPSADAVWQDGAWSVPPVPAVTAEQHLASVGLAGDRQPTLLYLRLNLQAAGKTSPELDQLETYLSGILSIFAADPSPRNDWPQPPITFEAAVQSAMAVLTETPA